MYKIKIKYNGPFKYFYYCPEKLFYYVKSMDNDVIDFTDYCDDNFKERLINLKIQKTNKIIKTEDENFLELLFNKKENAIFWKFKLNPKIEKIDNAPKNDKIIMSYDSFFKDIIPVKYSVKHQTWIDVEEFLVNKIHGVTKEYHRSYCNLICWLPEFNKKCMKMIIKNMIEIEKKKKQKCMVP